MAARNQPVQVRGHRRGELRDFLMSRRARLSPADVGMPDAGRRRTPGLRREEVAVLAGVGLSWYTWLEQGREINVSESVLNAISRALLLTEPERRHLHLLAGLNPAEMPGPPDLPVAPELQRVLESWLPRPAFILDRYWNFGAVNDAARAVFGYGQDDHNCLITFFTSARIRAAIGSWPDRASDIVADFRGDSARFPEDPRFDRLATKLSEVSPEFTELWSRHEVGDYPHGVMTLTDPDVGELVLEFTSLQIADRRGYRLFLFNPKPGTLTGARLNKLMAGLRLVDTG